MNKFVFIASFMLMLFGCNKMVDTIENTNPLCVDKFEITGILKDRYGETAIWAGANENEVFVVYASSQGTWSLVSFGDMEACVEAYGPYFETFLNAPKYDSYYRETNF